MSQFLAKSMLEDIVEVARNVRELHDFAITSQAQIERFKQEPDTGKLCPNAMALGAMFALTCALEALVADGEVTK